VVAFGIAGIKVIIVALIFMELRESLPATRLISVIAVLFVALLVLGVLGDVAFR
jgi:caa(3)-type oxidase subunit IV